jgi:hypothetical protein
MPRIAIVGFLIVGWYVSRSEQERRELYAAGWKTLEQTAMRVAKFSANIADTASRRYKETVSL